MEQQRQRPAPSSPPADPGNLPRVSARRDEILNSLEEADAILDDLRSENSVAWAYANRQNAGQ